MLRVRMTTQRMFLFWVRRDRRYTDIQSLNHSRAVFDRRLMITVILVSRPSPENKQVPLQIGPTAYVPDLPGRLSEINMAMSGQGGTGASRTLATGVM